MLIVADPVIEQRVCNVLSNCTEEELGQLIDAQNNLGQTPLHLAIIVNKDEIFDELIRLGANPAVQNHEGETSFHLATNLGKNNYLKAITSNASPGTLDIRCNSGKSALHIAIGNENLEAFKHLLEKGVGVDLKNEKTGETPLHCAVQKRNKAMIKMLLDDYGADVKAQTKHGDTPLHFIKSADDRELARLLLDKGADIYIKNNDGKSPHDLADKTLKRFLIRNRKDRKTRRKKGKNEPMDEDTKLQSNEKSTAFVPLSSVFKPKESKISRLGDASGSDTAIKAEPGASFANGANTNYNVFQPDEFQNILDSAALEQEQATQNIAFDIMSSSYQINNSAQSNDEGKIDITDALRLDASDEDNQWHPSSTDASPEISYPNGNVNFNQTICGSSPSESEQQTSVLSVQPRLQASNSQQSPTTMPLATQASPDFSHAQYAALSPIYTHQTSQNVLSQASPLNVQTLQQVLPRTFPASPVVSTSTVLQEMSSPSTLTLSSIHLPQQIVANSSHEQALANILQVCQMLASPSNVNAVREILVNAMSSTSATVSHHGNGSTANVNSSSLNGIDAALEAAGVIDQENKDFAQKMPEVLKTIEKLAHILGFEPVDLLNKIFSPTSPLHPSQ